MAPNSKNVTYYIVGNTQKNLLQTDIRPHLH